MSKRNILLEKIARTAFEYLSISLIAYALFKYNSVMAYIERGHKACGGEYFLLLTPAIYYFTKLNIIAWIEIIKSIKKA